MTDLHVDPDRLVEHARRLTAVLDALVPLPRFDDDAGAVPPEAQRIHTELCRAAGEIADLAEALVAVSTASAAAEGRTVESLARLLGELG